MLLKQQKGMQIIGLLSLVLVLTFSSCNIAGDAKSGTQSSLNQQLTQAVLWHQNSGERNALCYQAYNLATLRLDQYLASKEDDARPCVIVDIDETVVDNSPFQAQGIKSDFMYPKYWHEWVETATAKAIPGALDFLNHAVDNNVEVFYISNRNERNREATLKNLKDLGFPNANNQNLFLKKTHAVKDSLRAVLGVDHEIVLLVGDNLDDFSAVFKHQSVEVRTSYVDSFREEFGNRFIVTPNAIYGDWEGAVYNFEYSKSEEEKIKDRMNRLTGFDVPE